MVLFIPGFYKHGAPDLAFACSGVGLYTGAAMASIAAGESVAVVDANVMRFSFSLNSSGGPQHMILYSRNGRAMHRLNAVSMPCKGERGGGGGGTAHALRWFAVTRESMSVISAFTVNCRRNTGHAVISGKGSESL